MEKANIILQKNVESTTNKIRIPKNVVEKLGKKFYMEIYHDKIVLKPISKEE